MMPDSRLQTQEHAYRDASRAYDYFVTGLSSLLFLSTALFFEPGQKPQVLNVLDVAAIVLFALAVVAGLKKLEYYVAVLGTDYSIALTKTNQSQLTFRESTGVVRDLNDAVERLTQRASVAHRLRSWFFLLGLVTLIASRVG